MRVLTILMAGFLWGMPALASTDDLSTDGDFVILSGHMDSLSWGYVGVDTPDFSFVIGEAFWFGPADQDSSDTLTGWIVPGHEDSLFYVSEEILAGDCGSDRAGLELLILALDDVGEVAQTT